YEAGSIDERAKQKRAVGGSGERIDRVFGMRHQPHDVALGVDEAGDSGDRAVGALALVAEHDLSGVLEVGEQLRGGEEAAFAVLDRAAETPPLSTPRCVWGVC